jgi:ribose-phosphate pyrophosphokinase
MTQSRAMASENSMMLFAGTSHPELAQQLATCLGIRLGKAIIETFPDGEIGVQVLESVRGRDVFVLQTIARRPSFYLMELLILVDALKRASARSIVAVIPYFGYARQDRRGLGRREPITAKLVANMLEKAGVTCVLTMDLHTEQIQGFFDIPLDNLYARPLLVEAVGKLKLNKTVVVTPDVGSIKLARSFAQALHVEFAIIDKRRVNALQVGKSALIGNVDGCDVLLVDDVCSTGETLKMAAMECRKAGARRICAAVTHGLIIGEAFEESAIEKMLVTNTVPVLEETSLSKLEIVSVAPLFGKAIEYMLDAKSISSLYD